MQGCTYTPNEITGETTPPVRQGEHFDEPREKLGVSGAQWNSSYTQNIPEYRHKKINCGKKKLKWNRSLIEYSLLTQRTRATLPLSISPKYGQLMPQYLGKRTHCIGKNMWHTSSRLTRMACTFRRYFGIGWSRTVSHVGRHRQSKDHSTPGCVRSTASRLFDWFHLIPGQNLSSGCSGGQQRTCSLAHVIYKTHTHTPI